MCSTYILHFKLKIHTILKIDTTSMLFVYYGGSWTLMFTKWSQESVHLWKVRECYSSVVLLSYRYLLSFLLEYIFYIKTCIWLLIPFGMNTSSLNHDESIQKDESNWVSDWLLISSWMCSAIRCRWYHMDWWNGCISSVCEGATSVCVTFELKKEIR